MKELIENIHYYVNDEGLIVFTEQFHLEKGFCCGIGCKHCPYRYENVEEPKRTLLLQQKENADK